MEDRDLGARIVTCRRCLYAAVLGLLTLAFFYVAILVFTEPSAVQDARRLNLAVQPDFNTAHYRVGTIVNSADDRYWLVKFVRVEGASQEEYVVNVPHRETWLSRMISFMRSGANTPSP